MNNEHADTRAGDANPLGKMIQGAFGAADLRTAMKNFDTAVKAEGLTPAKAAIRWVAHHSVLNEKDGIILGASKISQIRESVDFVRKGKLPENVLRLTDKLWEAVQESRGNIC